MAEVSHKKGPGIGISLVIMTASRVEGDGRLHSAQIDLLEPFGCSYLSYLSTSYCYSLSYWLPCAHMLFCLVAFIVRKATRTLQSLDSVVTEIFEAPTWLAWMSLF